MTGEAALPIQVVFIPEYRDKLERWLALSGLELFPIPNGERDGELVLDSPDDLRTYGVRKAEA